MENSIEYALLNLLVDDKNLITYRPKLNKITGSVNSTILLQQILYWSQKSNFKQFYKFKESCKHELYTKGDSWCEELGFTRREFDTALNKLRSQKLISSWTNRERITYYNLNIKILNEELKKLYSQTEQNALYLKAESAFSKRTNQPFDYITETTTENNIYVESKDSDKNINLKDKKKISKTKKTSYSSNFEIIWNEYDKKSGNKKRAFTIYKKMFLKTDVNLIIAAIKKYKELKENWRDLKDFDGFLNGMIETYIPRAAWVIDTQGNKHTGLFYDCENKFVVGETMGQILSKEKIDELLKQKRIGFIED